MVALRRHRRCRIEAATQGKMQVDAVDDPGVARLGDRRPTLELSLLKPEDRRHVHRPGPPLFTPSHAVRRSSRMSRESLYAHENLPEELARQVAFRELQGEVPRMPNEASARLEQPLLETR